ncbi:MAG: response regulator [Myxococcota bacterium]|nr:response regulator [bacterium]MDP6244381.1 response regulator [Myxococcota bacterium]MDP7073385.1 response regulator [Myxococcota bacterium]MDP7297852.1 response regulator [Myxococcota bacterium]MDP7432417.1 response regulator [Myxococcota bacterium]
MPSRKHTVLFVDDEVHILNALRRLLRAEDMTVLCASRPQQALELLDHHPVQIVVSDQRMPEMSGVDLLSRVRKRHPGLVRMLLTGCTEMDVGIDAIHRGGIYRFMPKPWNGAELRATLRQAFDHFDGKAKIEHLSRPTLQQSRELQDMNRSLDKPAQKHTRQRDAALRKLRGV